MTKEFDNKKMWASLIKHTATIGTLIKKALKDQGFEFDGNNIVPIEPEFKIKAGKWYMCIKDRHATSDIYHKGKVYVSEIIGCITDEKGEKDIVWEGWGAAEYFRPATEEEIEYCMETKFKAGDIVIYIASHPAYSGIYILGAPNDLHIGYNNAGNPYNLALRNCTLATEPERSKFEKELKLNGYEWDAVKKELSHSEPTKTSDKELTEFEKAVGVAIGSWNPDEEGKKGVRAVANKLLSIARKQFVKELPKWEKCTLPNYNSGWGINSDYLINPKGNYIKLSEIENVFENNYE